MLLHSQNPLKAETSCSECKQAKKSKSVQQPANGTVERANNGFPKGREIAVIQINWWKGYVEGKIGTATIYDCPDNQGL